MPHSQPQKNIFYKTLSVFILASFLFAPLVSYARVAPITPTSSIIQEMIPLESIIQIPKMVVGEKILPDISRIDWEQEVNINGNPVALNSDEALNALAMRRQQSTKQCLDCRG